MVSVDIKHNVYSGWPPIHCAQTLARVSKALAKHISCRWPTENSRPRSPTSDPRPPRRWTTVARWQRSSRAHNSASERAPVGSRFKRTEPLKRNGSWGMMAKRDLQTVSKQVTWCFMPSQPLRLYHQGETRKQNCFEMKRMNCFRQAKIFIHVSVGFFFSLFFFFNLNIRLGCCFLLLFSIEMQLSCLFNALGLKTFPVPLTIQVTLYHCTIVYHVTCCSKGHLTSTTR